MIEGRSFIHKNFFRELYRIQSDLSLILIAYQIDQCSKKAQSKIVNLFMWQLIVLNLVSKKTVQIVMKSLSFNTVFVSSRTVNSSD